MEYLLSLKGFSHLPAGVLWHAGRDYRW